MSPTSYSVRLSTEHKGRRRREPVWIGRYRAGNTDSAKVLGKAWQLRSRPSEGYLTKGMAEEALRAFLAREGARLAAAGGVTFDQTADAYLEALEARVTGADFRATTLRTYRNIIDHDLRAHFGARGLAAITGADVQTYRAQLVDRGLRPSTINQHRAVLSGVFKLAVRRYSLPADPSGAFDRARTRATGSGEIRFYTPEQVEQLCSTAASAQDAAVYRTAAFTGLRLSEVRALRWRAVDFDRSLVHVERGYTDEGGHALPKSWKVRSVPMMPQVAHTLADLRGREHFTEDEALVFVNDVGGQVCGSALYRRFVAAAERAGLPRLRFHDLRHSFGTMAAQAFSLGDVKEMMGHAHIATTMVYTHYVPRSDAAAKLGALVAERTPAAPARLRLAG
jgi:integrase